MRPRPLANLIEPVPEPNILGDTSAIDFFEDALSIIFDDARNQHGEPGTAVLYKAEVWLGRDIVLHLADPKSEDNSLFAHFVWNVRGLFRGGSG